MNILHIAPNATYNDYWGYQDNLLPKYHKKMGHDVTIIVPNYIFEDGKPVIVDEDDYNLKDGVRVIRRAYKKYKHPIITYYFSYIPIYDLLQEIKPDFIFFHGLVSLSIKDVIKYKKRNICTIVEDNHLDYNIGPNPTSIKQNLVRLYYRLLNRYSIRYVEKVYGVTPWRKQYAEDYYGIPSNKTDVLIMGADDEKINFQEKEKIRAYLRDKYDIKETDFLIVTGGKIDKNKGVEVLAEACLNIGEPVKLIIFGNILDDIRESINAILSKASNIINVGWIDADKVYDYFFAADLVFFPGQHSVLWEQACAAKVPCVFKRWDGMEHVDNGGNCSFIEDVTAENVMNLIRSLLHSEDYYEMKKNAESEATDIFLYSVIAEKSLECL